CRTARTGPARAAPTARPEGHAGGVNRTILRRAGALAGPLFVAAFLAEGASRSDYDPLRHPVSALARGPRGWQQRANFAVAGTLLLAGRSGSVGGVGWSGRPRSACSARARSAPTRSSATRPASPRRRRRRARRTT